ncbi:MAG: NUDIX hydrolase [Micromonosporaceae bacterium]|jgi:ADP-ribose pyrophosphatase YjhB (NUDIX family)|nr:NUDIX hydrolase [Micromonosporaceae bacterium]
MSHLTAAVAAVITDPAGRVLLCQQSQGHRLWSLPGGRIRHDESPVHAAIRDIREETGMETHIQDLVGIYHLTGDGCGTDLPDVLVHVFRARVDAGDATVNSGRICRLSWQHPDALPQPMTATTRIALADAIAGRAGVLREVVRDVDPAVVEAATVPAQPGDLALVSP